MLETTTEGTAPQSGTEAGSANEARGSRSGPSEWDSVLAIAVGAVRASAGYLVLFEDDRPTFAASLGGDVARLDPESVFLDNVVASRSTRIVGDVLVADALGAFGGEAAGRRLRACIGLPLIAADGSVLGAICLFDERVRNFEASEVTLLENVAVDSSMRIARRAGRDRKQKLMYEHAMLIDMILHDARGVMSALRWGLDALEGEFAEVPASLSHCQQAVAELSRLCGDVHGINSAEGASIRIDPRPTDVRSWVDGFGKSVSELVGRDGLTLVVDNQLPQASFSVDIHVIERVLTNLVRNAIAASRIGPGSSLLIEAIGRDPGAIEFSVSDDGPGVPADIRARIFEPYFSTAAGEHGGKGLGLAFGRLAARALGGTLEFSPREPHGAVFVLRVPFGDSDLNSGAAGV